MPTNTDYVLGGFSALGQGIPGLQAEIGKRQEATRLEQEQSRQLHPGFQKYLQAVLSGQMDPREAATRLKLEAQQGGGMSQAPQGGMLGPQPPSPGGAQPSLLAGAKPTLAPADGGLMGGPTLQAPQAGGSLMQGAPPPAPAPQPQAQAPQTQERPFTVRDLGDFEKLRGFYQSQQATQRESTRRESVEREGEKSRSQRERLTDKRIRSAEDIAELMSGQRERASQRSFAARMAAIKAMERTSVSRRTQAKDVAVFLEEGRNLRAARADISRKMSAAAQSLDPAISSRLIQEAQKELEELNTLEAAYAPILQKMRERTGLSDQELLDLGSLTGEEETETFERSTPLGAR
jgi:hypothetical protein